MNKNNRSNNSLPAALVSRLEDIFGSFFFKQVQITFVSRPVTFRINTIKNSRKEVMDELSANGLKVKTVPWYSDALILINKKQSELEKTGLYQNGKIYLQSLASMIPPLVLAPQPGEKVLDLTAAPGSKTSQIAAMMHLQGELVANDNNEIRFQKLRHNLALLGCCPFLNCHPERSEGSVPLVSGQIHRFALNDSEERRFCTVYNENGHKLCQRFPNYFDKILLDAPCSAEARIILAEHRTYGFWNERNIKDLAFAQRQLLRAAWGALKPGGVLVYSTCTFAPEENEAQISKFLESFPEAKIIESRLDGLQKAEPVVKWKDKELNKKVKKCWRLLPTNNVEGFFICKILKK